MTETQYRKKWMRLHSKYEKQAYKIFVKAFRDICNDIPFDKLTDANVDIMINSSVPQNKIFSAYFDVYNTIGKQHAKVVGKEINIQLKEFNFDAFLGEWEKRMLEWLFQNSSYRVVSVHEGLLKYLREVIAFGRAEGKTISEISTDLERLINNRNFYRWQSLRIARTETTAAANLATMTSTDISGVATDKVWISSQDVRTRRPPKSPFNHFAMNGVRVPQNERFDVNGDKLMFPGDPKGKEGNVINCRCSIAIVVRRNEDGTIVQSNGIPIV